jgi:hypothetical protein
MAKKARRKLDEEDEPAFEFPTFDEDQFATKEFELGTGLMLAGLFTIGIGVAAWGLSVAGVPWFGGLVLAIALMIASPFVIRRLRQLSSLYTKGDWAGLIALEFFGSLAVWFLLLSLSAPN